MTLKRTDNRQDSDDEARQVVAEHGEAAFEFLSEEAVADLNPRQRAEYALHRRRFIAWMRTCGKDPKAGDPLSETCIENYARRLHQMHRWLWSRSDRCSVRIDRGQADTIVEALHEDDLRRQDGTGYAASSKRKFVNVLEKWFDYLTHAYGAEPWEPPVTFTDNAPTNAADYFTKAERTRLYETALTYKTPPAYDNLTPAERDRWKAYLAQRLGKPKAEVRPADFEERRTSWKIPSLIGATLDGGLRPIEINRMRMGWLHLDKGAIWVPKEFAAKSGESWEITLRERTVLALRRWMQQRAAKERYDGRDEVWLTRNGHPYTSKTLNYLLDNLLEAAGISQENRNLIWYSFRKSTGQYVHSVSDDLTTAAILRSTQENVRNYAGPTHEEKRAILERIDD
jgi:site-specific recombinase XerD